MKPLTGPSTHSQQRRHSDYKLPPNEVNRKSTGSDTKFLDTIGDFGSRQYPSDSIEAKILNGYSAEMRRHSFPGSLPHPRDFIPLGGRSGAIENLQSQASLDSIGSKSLAQYSSSSPSQSLFSQSSPVSWLEVRRKSLVDNPILPSHQHSISRTQATHSSNSSDVISPSTGIPKGLPPLTQHLVGPSSRVKYSPMFTQNDVFSSPFTASTIFEKAAAIPRVRQTEVSKTRIWRAPAPKYQPAESALSERNGELQLRDGVSPIQQDSIESRNPAPSSSQLPADFKEFSNKGTLSAGSVSAIQSTVKQAESSNIRDGRPSLPDLVLPRNITIHTTPNQGPETEKSKPNSKDAHIPDISGLSLGGTPHAAKRPDPALAASAERAGDRHFRTKEAPKQRKRVESDEDDQSGTDSDSGDIRERDLPGIDVSSDHDSDDDPSRSRSFWQAKRELYKTEICLNWLRTRNCSYGNKCHYAHGMADLRTRQRIETYKTQPCADPARNGCHVCMYTSRCNYAHPGEPIRRMGPHPGKKYFDPEYFEALRRDYPYHEMPFGVFV